MEVNVLFIVTDLLLVVILLKDHPRKVLFSGAVEETMV